MVKKEFGREFVLRFVEKSPIFHVGSKEVWWHGLNKISPALYGTPKWTFPATFI